MVQVGEPQLDIVKLIPESLRANDIGFVLSFLQNINILSPNLLAFLQLHSEGPQPLTSILLSWSMNRAHASSECSQEIGLNLNRQNINLIGLCASKLQEKGMLPLILVHHSLIQRVGLDVLRLSETRFLDVSQINFTKCLGILNHCQSGIVIIKTLICHKFSSMSVNLSYLLDKILDAEN